jgi:hypothetical protein
MEKLACTVLVGFIALLAWLVWMALDMAPSEDSWIRLLGEAERGQVLDEKVGASRRFLLVLDQTDRAITQENLPLEEAAALLLDSARRHYPDFLQSVHTFSASHACVEPRPPQDADLVEQVAWVVVRRFRLEMHVYGNPRGYPADLLPRLERELRDMRSRAGAPDKQP